MTELQTQEKQKSLQAHWDRVYTDKAPTEVSWYEDDPRRSLEWIRKAAPQRRRRILDVGGGASVLVDRLLEMDYATVAVLDISSRALATARARLGPRADQALWLVGDVTRLAQLPRFDVWHDRAVFHFLTLEEDRLAYRELAAQTLPSGGHMIVATFAPDGPERCSGLPVCRYDATALATAIGPSFTLLESIQEMHHTPWGMQQPFTYCRFRRR